VAESILSGPQHLASGTIRLRVLQGGFGTVADPPVRVTGTELVAADSRRVPLQGRLADIAAAAGLSAVVPDIYSDHAEVGPADEVEVDAREAARLSSWLARGEAALALVAPASQRVLWPEHFDLAIAVEEVNLGVSPGDRDHPEPYAYVGPWDAGELLRADHHPYWNAGFGAILDAQAAVDTEAIARFFRAGMVRVRQARRAADH
jgi:hypothetical protein